MMSRNRIGLLFFWGVLAVVVVADVADRRRNTQPKHVLEEVKALRQVVDQIRLDVDSNTEALGVD